MRAMHASSSSTGEISFVPMRRRSSTAVSESSDSLAGMFPLPDRHSFILPSTTHRYANISRTPRSGKESNDLVRCASAVLAVVWTAAAGAAGYPDRPLRYVIPSAAGGGPDIAARLVMNQLSRQLGQQIIVDNRAGASGVIGTDLIAKAAPDGYTLGHGNILTMAIGPSVHLKLPYDPVKSFQPVVHMYGTPNLLAVTLSLPVNSVQELVAYAKKNPDKLLFASAGSGSSVHVGMELFKLMTGTQMVHIPFKAADSGDHRPDRGPRTGDGRQHQLDRSAREIGPVARPRGHRRETRTGVRGPADVAEAGVPGFDVSRGRGSSCPRVRPGSPSRG